MWHRSKAATALHSREGWDTYGGSAPIVRETEIRDPWTADATSRREFLTTAAFLPWIFWWRRPRYARIEFQVLRHGRSKRRYLLIHGNERTAHSVLTTHMKSHAGIAHLVTGAERNIKNTGLAFDPNRIWSREGAEKNLRSLNPQASAEARELVLKMLDKGRPRLIKAILPPSPGLLVAMHNNSRGYSVEDEVPISDQVSLNDRANPHEFMLATDPADYAILSKSPFNVVLQKNAPPEDDGSLSRLAAKQGVRYVNIEAGIGNTVKQQAMLAWLEQNLPE